METLLPATTRFGLLRHGKTQWNSAKRIQGRRDSPLTPEGIHDCQRWADFLADGAISWQRIIASPLARAMTTAEIINRKLNLPVHVEEGLREQDWGRWEGMSLPEIKTADRDELEQRIKLGWDFRAPEGESRREVARRALAALEKCRLRWPGQNLLTVSHLGVIKALLYRIEEREYLPYEPKIAWQNRFHVIMHADGNYSVQQSEIPLPEGP